MWFAGPEFIDIRPTVVVELRKIKIEDSYKR